MNPDMARTVVAVFCMPEHGHFMQLRALIAGFVHAGCEVHVYAHRRYAPAVERLGARLVDLFTAHPIELADNESIPVPCRYVTYAAHYAEDVLADLRRIRPALIVCETFAVIGRLAAQQLGIPFVNVLPGHNIQPVRYLAALRSDPRVAVSDRCHRAVAILRERYGLDDASPISYIAGNSPYLNICSEPAEFLTAEDRESFEPIAFFGCIPAPEDLTQQSADAGRPHFAGSPGRLRIYACCGTVAFRYFSDAIISLFEALSEAVAGRPDARALISLGGATADEGTRRRLRRPNVETVDYADQWAVLGKTDIFLTHHGLNSTHEAIFRRVPMLSYPIFSDQPAMAKRCQEFGIAVPLTASLRSPVTADDVRAALAAVVAGREAMMARIDRARSKELEVMAQRPAVLARIMGLIRAGA